MSNDQVVKGWGWVLVLLLAGMLVAPMLGCKPGIDAINITKAAGYQAPADFETGVSDTKWLQSADGKTIYWEKTYKNDTQNMRFYPTTPTLTVKDDAGKIVWIGNDFKEWNAKPGKGGRVSGKIVIPDWALKPTLHWEKGSDPSTEINGSVK